MAVMGAVVRALASRLCAVGIRQWVAALALVCGEVTTLALKGARLLALILGVLAPGLSLRAGLALLGLQVATGILGGLAVLLAVRLRRVRAVGSDHAGGLGDGVVARITSAVLSAEVLVAHEGHGLAGDEATTLQTGIASVVVDDGGAHAPTALEVTRVLANTRAAGQEVVAGVGVVLDLGHTAAHDSDGLARSLRMAEDVARALKEARRAGEGAEHRGHDSLAGEDAGEIALALLPGVALGQSVNTHVVLQMLIQRIKLCLTHFGIECMLNGVRDGSIVVAEGESDSEGLGAVGHLGGEDIDLGALMGSVNEGDHHVSNGGNCIW
jgi:hypothetical protein